MTISDFKFIVLAAGKGKRMKSENPKVLTPLMGKPFILHILETLRKLNTEIKPVVVVGHQKEKIIALLGESCDYAVQEEQLGTGHAVLSAKETLQDHTGPIAVVFGDQPLLSETTLKKIMAAHLREKPVLTLATITVPDFSDWREGLLRFGRIKREGSQIVKMIEYKDCSPEEKEIRELNLAIFAFDPVWLWKHLAMLKNENSQGEYYLTDLVNIACAENAKIVTVESENILEALQPNSREELETLEKLMA